jgi:hypothetical protein
MSVAAKKPITVTDGVLVEPPLGSVTLEISSETVRMCFPDGDVEEFPRAAVKAIGSSDFTVNIHWAGAPVQMSFATLSSSTRVFNELDGAGDANRTFTFLVDETEMTARKLGLTPAPEPIASKTRSFRYAIVGLSGVAAAALAYAGVSLLV